MQSNLPERSKRPSPGELFVAACATSGTDTAVEYDYTITDTILSTRRKTRYPVRNMFKIVNLAERPLKYYWYESPPQAGDMEDVLEAELRPEAAHHFQKHPVPELYPTTAWVQVPPELLEDPETLATFINYRLVIRLCTAENQALTLGPGGLLNIPAITTIASKGVFSSPLLAACNQIEQMGCTPDGLILNPLDFYKLMGSSRILFDLEENGMIIARTRMVKPGHAIMGDFAQGAMLFDQGKSVIRFAEPPPGIFAQPGLALMAEIYERVVVNVPAIFYHVALDG